MRPLIFNQDQRRSTIKHFLEAHGPQTIVKLEGERGINNNFIIITVKNE